MFLLHFVTDTARFLKECHILYQDLSFLCSFGAAIDVPVLGGIHSGVEEAKRGQKIWTDLG